MAEHVWQESTDMCVVCWQNLHVVGSASECPGKPVTAPTHPPVAAASRDDVVAVPRWAAEKITEAVGELDKKQIAYDIGPFDYESAKAIADALRTPARDVGDTVRVQAVSDAMAHAGLKRWLYERHIDLEPGEPSYEECFPQFRRALTAALSAAPPIADAGPVVEAARKARSLIDQALGDTDPPDPDHPLLRACQVLSAALAEYDRTNQPGTQGGERG